MSSTLAFWMLRNSVIKKEFQTPHPSPSSASQPTKHLSTWCWVPPKKLTFAELLKKFSVFYWTSFNIAFVPLHTVTFILPKSNSLCPVTGCGKTLLCTTLCKETVWENPCLKIPMIIINEPSTPHTHTPPPKKKEEKGSKYSRFFTTMIHIRNSHESELSVAGQNRQTVILVLGNS